MVVVPHWTFKKNSVTIGVCFSSTMNVNESQLVNEERVENAVVTYEVSDDESITHAVTTAMSLATETTEAELQPLYSVIDPDALDTLFAPRPDGTPRDSGGTVTFEYGPYRVRIERDRTVVIY